MHSLSNICQKNDSAQLFQEIIWPPSPLYIQELSVAQAGWTGVLLALLLLITAKIQEHRQPFTLMADTTCFSVCHRVLSTAAWPLAQTMSHRHGYEDEYP